MFIPCWVLAVASCVVLCLVHPDFSQTVFYLFFYICSTNTNQKWSNVCTQIICFWYLVHPNKFGLRGHTCAMTAVVVKKEKDRVKEERDREGEREKHTCNLPVTISRLLFAHLSNHLKKKKRSKNKILKQSNHANLNHTQASIRRIWLSAGHWLAHVCFYSTQQGIIICSWGCLLASALIAWNATPITQTPNILSLLRCVAFLPTHSLFFDHRNISLC